MKKENITLISFGGFKEKFLNSLAVEIGKSFSCQVMIRNGNIDLSDFYDMNRNQYDANKILLYLKDNFSEEDTKITGLVSVDLFIPIFTYIFGQAFLNGNTALVSSFRLQNERYGLKADDKIFFERLKKEIIHELGHSFGLIHCSVPDCVMRSGSYVEEIDQRSSEFCHACSIKLTENIQK